MYPEPYDIVQDDKATEPILWDCPWYYCGWKQDIGRCRLNDMLCLQETDPPCPYFEEFLDETSTLKSKG